MPHYRIRNLKSSALPLNKEPVLDSWLPAWEVCTLWLTAHDVNIASALSSRYCLDGSDPHTVCTLMYILFMILMVMNDMVVCLGMLVVCHKSLFVFSQSCQSCGAV